MPIIDTMKVKKAIEYLPPDMNLSDVPDKVRAELSGLDGADLAKGLLGYYMNKNMPDNIDLGPSSVKYRPKPGSEYSLDFKPGDVRFGAKWEF